MTSQARHSLPVALRPYDGTATGKIYFRAADLQPGQNQLIATYAGDTNYSGSVSMTTLALDDPTDFSIQSSDTTIAIAAGNAASEGITFTSMSGFNGKVQVSCIVASSLICTPATTSVSLNGTASTTVMINTVTTAPAMAGNQPGGPGWLRTSAGATLACLLLFMLPGRRRLGRVLLSALVMMMMLSDVGCSGGGKSAGPTTVSTDAKPGTYTVLVTGTGSNGIVHDVPVTVIVH